MPRKSRSSCMPVVVRLSPLLRKYRSDYDHEKGIIMQEGAGKRISELVEELEIPEEMVTSVLVNHRPSRSSFVEANGDQVLLAMVIGGG